jgi:hypothetical protein
LLKRFPRYTGELCLIRVFDVFVMKVLRDIGRQSIALLREAFDVRATR